MGSRMPRACIVGFHCSDNGIALPGTSRCRAYTRSSGWARYAAQYPERAAFYRGGGWRAARERHLRAHPNCAVCGVKAVAVDHIRNRAEGGGDLDPANLQSLCPEHHHQKTVEEGHWGMKRRARRRSVARRRENEP
jgi:5-methylcytosine-specific restriction enzyme A